MSDPKERVTITLDGKLIRAIDEIAEARGDSRSAVIERMLFNEVPEERRFLRAMENPVMRAIVQTMTASPGLMESIALLVGDKMSEEDLKHIRDGVAKQAERARERKRGKRVSDSGGAVDGAQRC